LTHDNFPEVKQIYKKLTPIEWSFSKFTMKDAYCGTGIKNAHKQRNLDWRTKKDYSGYSFQWKPRKKQKQKVLESKDRKIK
jgi:hypothetical protein